MERNGTGFGDALKSCTQDGSISGCLFILWKKRRLPERHFVSYRQAKEAGKGSFPGLDGGKSVCYDDVPPEKPWIDDAKKQRDKFYQLIMDNDEKGACLFQKTLYEKLVSHHLCMNF